MFYLSLSLVMIQILNKITNDPWQLIDPYLFIWPQRFFLSSLFQTKEASMTPHTNTHNTKQLNDKVS